MNESVRKRRFLGLHWKGFLWISVLLISLSAAFYALSYQELKSQFRQYRHSEAMALRRQIGTLLTSASDRLIRLSGALASMANLGKVLRQQDEANAITQLPAERFASLGFELDIRRIELYTPEAELVWNWADSNDDSITDSLRRDMVRRVRAEEKPVSRLVCRPQCVLLAFVPVLAEGTNVGVMAIGKSVADFIIEFNVITNAQLALIMPTSSRDEPGDLRNWSARVAGVTSAADMTRFLDDLAERFDSPTALHGGQIIGWRGASFDAHFMPLSDIMSGHDGFVVLVSDVTAQLSEIDKAVKKGLLVTGAALVLAELSLLYLVGVPIRRLERFARTLPLLADRSYQQARDFLSQRRDSVLVRDEIDILYESAITLSQQLEENSEALAKKNQELAMDRDFIQGLLASAQVLVMTQTRNGIIRIANEFAAQLIGVPAAQLGGRQFIELIADPAEHDDILCSIESLCAHGHARLEHEHELMGVGGVRRQIVWVHTPLKTAHTDGTSVLSVGLDVTERVEAESRMRWLANHDPLTELANRHCFLEKITATLNEAARTGHTAALLLFDLDHFKEINDTSGHAAGDALLRFIAGEIKARIRKSDMAARLGGDEFAVLMPHTDTDGAQSFARQLIELFKTQAFSFGEQRYSVTVSIGIALLPRHGADVQEVMANADMAMYEAKRSGRSRVHLFAYEHQQAANFSQSVYWKDILAGAFAERRLFFHFQPIVDTGTLACVWYEALIRLGMPDGRIAMPGEFFEHAQRAGLTDELDMYVVRAALKTLLAEPNRCLSINLSAAAFSDPAWTAPVIEAVNKHHLNPARLIFEITETAVIADMEKAKHIADEVAALGFRFAVDDFGSGFSSLYYLKQLPISFVKLDHSLVNNLSTDKSEQDFLSALITMVHVYGKKVVGEGVEDAATLALLRELGVDLVQGYYIGRPNASMSGKLDATSDREPFSGP